MASALSRRYLHVGGSTRGTATLLYPVDLDRFQGHGGWFLPIPATLVIGKDGHVKARFVDPDFRHRMGIEAILSALADRTDAETNPVRA